MNDQDIYNKNVSYILVAEFDIDKGNTITFQYPKDTEEDKQLLAELMLPDGVHKRDSDWTVFFLNRPSSNNNSLIKQNKEETIIDKKIVLTNTTINNQNNNNNFGPPVEVFVYVYDVSNKMESQNSWEPIYGTTKKLLYFEQNGIKIIDENQNLLRFIENHNDIEYTSLEELFLCVLSNDGRAFGFRFNSITDASKFSTHIQFLIQENQKINEKILNLEEKKIKNEENINDKKPFLYCLNLVINQKDNSVRRGAIVKAMAICTRHQYIHIYKPLIILALQKFYQNPSIEVLAQFYSALNDMDISEMPSYSIHQKQIYRNSNDNNKQEFLTTVNYLQTKINVKIPTILFPDEVGDVKVTHLIKKFGSSIMHIYNGLLSQKRILFVGFDCSAGEVCEYVLSTCSLICPPLTGLVKKAFPYTNLTYLDFLSVDGYIAGVTNPVFESHVEWWDILCNINTGKITLSPTLMVHKQFEKYTFFDNEFMTQVQSSIAAHYGEDTIRSLFQSYTQHIIDMAFDEEEFPDSISKENEIKSNTQRIEKWKGTQIYRDYLKLRSNRTGLSIADSLIPRYIRKLRICNNISEKEILEIYKTFIKNIETEDQLTEFLSYFPSSSGGLYPIAVSLFHHSELVRIETAKLLKRLDSLQTGSNFITKLNFFLCSAYEKILNFIPETSSNKKI